MSIKLITRGDDCASSTSANKAIKECIDDGILKNVSIMATCDKLYEAYDLFSNNKNICLGMHTTMNAEWDLVKWHPVSPIEKVKTIVDENNYFYNTPKLMHKMNIDIDEIMLEMSNQLDLLCKIGFNIEYIDSHMLFEVHNTDLKCMFDEFCNKKGLLNYRYYTNRLPNIQSDYNLVDKLIMQLKKLN